MLSQATVSHPRLSNPILDTESPCKNAEISDPDPLFLFVISVILSCDPSAFSQLATIGSLSANPSDPPDAIVASNTSDLSGFSF